MLQNLQRQLQAYGRAAWLWVQPFKWRLGYFLVFIFFIWYKDFQFQVQLNSGKVQQTAVVSEKLELKNQEMTSSDPVTLRSKSEFFTKSENPKQISLQNETPLPSTSAPQQRTYIRRFAHVARAEMKKYGIPASITLAQGLLESNSGKSPLATDANNHFGIKCFSRNCKKGHCKNFSDDSHKDFFRTYRSAWESYRAHSLFLQKDRYKHLQKLSKDDYRSWAVGLKKAGYATDPNYAKKLIRLIESLDLGKYDT